MLYHTDFRKKKHEKRVYSTLQPQFELGCGCCLWPPWAFLPSSLSNSRCYPSWPWLGRLARQSLPNWELKAPVKLNSIKCPPEIFQIDANRENNLFYAQATTKSLRVAKAESLWRFQPIWEIESFLALTPQFHPPAPTPSSTRDFLVISQCKATNPSFLLSNFDLGFSVSVKKESWETELMDEWM